MSNKSFASGLRAWLNHIPIQDTVDRYSASLLQGVLFGFIAIIGIAAVLNIVLPPRTIPWQIVLIRSGVFILIISVPLILLRRGYFHSSVLIVTGVFFFLESFAVLAAGLSKVTDTLSFFTLAIILAGLLVNRKSLTITFVLSTLVILLAIIREQDALARTDNITIAINFILLNGLISLFVGRFGLAFRNALDAALEREYELKTEIGIRRQAQLALQKSAARLEILHEIDRSLISARAPREIASDALVRIRQLIPCPRASTTLFDMNKQEASFLAASFHKPVTFPETPISFNEFGQRIIDKLQQNRPWLVDNILEDPGSTELDKQLANGNGIYAWLAVPLFYQGQLIGALNLGRGLGQAFSPEDAEIAQDVADQLAIALQQTNLYNALQLELAERKKLITQLEGNNAELERFTYTVSHDLRNPLVTIKGFLGMLRKDMQDQRQDRVQSDIERIGNAADKMHRLLTDLLELSRIGRIQNPPEEVDLNQVISEAIESLDARLRSKNVTVNSSLELPTVYGDRVRLREIFENLIDNAAKYTGDQPVPMIEIGTRESGNEPTIFVKDNGLGIDPQFQSKIFGLFDKLNPASEGTGIGLAIIKRIIETNGGKIWVESEGLGKGSTFCFTLPDGRKP